MLLFNKERVTDVNGTQDFNTSNVTIQPAETGLTCNSWYFNTSNVTIQLC